MTSVYDIVTQKITDNLEKGIVPWRKPWTVSYPMNYVTKKPYRGINSLLLSMSDYKSPYWLTFAQAKKMGGSIRKGEKSTLITFWKIDKKIDPQTKEEETQRLLRYYLVFNWEQTEGVPEIADSKMSDTSPMQDAENIVMGYKDKPEICHNNQNKAYYSPSLDVVNIPSMANFESKEGYYSTLFHELTHSTGHKSRLDRWAKESITDKQFGSESYSKEELVAELGACFLNATAGITPNYEQSTAYIAGWLRELKNDKRLIITASSKAQKAVDYITGVTA